MNHHLIASLARDPNSIDSLAKADIPAILSDLAELQAKLLLRLLAPPEVVETAPNPESEMPRLLLTISEAAKVLQMSTAWITRAIRSKELTSVRFGRSVRIRMADLEAYMETKKINDPDGNERK